MVMDGSLGYICPQSQPDWWTTALDANADHLSFSESKAQQQSEDCLFLDVVAPIINFEGNTVKSPGPGPALSPVLIWIHGGNYFNGDKNSFYASSGIVKQKQNDDNTVFVTMNYRVSIESCE